MDWIRSTEQRQIKIADRIGRRYGGRHDNAFSDDFPAFHNLEALAFSKQLMRSAFHHECNPGINDLSASQLICAENSQAPYATTLLRIGFEANWSGITIGWRRR